MWAEGSDCVGGGIDTAVKRRNLRKRVVVTGGRCLERGRMDNMRCKRVDRAFDVVDVSVNDTDVGHDAFD